MKDKLFSEVWTSKSYCSEMGTLDPVCWGQVIRQTAKSIWIKDQFNVIEKWNIQANGRWKCPSKFGRVEKDFEFKLDPFTKFVFSKEAAE